MIWIFLIVTICFTSTTYGHLGSLVEGTNPIGCCGLRLSHPRLGEAKSPVLPYSRVSRDPPKKAEFFEPDVRYQNFKPPSFQHKYFHSNRFSKFHQNGGQDGGSGPALLKSSLFGNGKLNNNEKYNEFERLLHSINASPIPGSNEEETFMENDEQPTFTPYIGARALSNMREFFEHLQENMEALRQDEDEGEFGGAGNESDENLAGEHRALPSTGFRSEWKPLASGDHGLKKIRSFFPFIDQETSRSRLGTNLGLGKRRRR